MMAKLPLSICFVKKEMFSLLLQELGFQRFVSLALGTTSTSSNLALALKGRCKTS